MFQKLFLMLHSEVKHQQMEQMTRHWNLLLFLRRLIIRDVNEVHVWPLGRGTVVIFQRMLTRKSQIKIKFSKTSVFFEDGQLPL